MEQNQLFYIFRVLQPRLQLNDELNSYKDTENSRPHSKIYKKKRKLPFKILNLIHQFGTLVQLSYILTNSIETDIEHIYSMYDILFNA